jgi:hypothetical protein
MMIAENKVMNAVYIDIGVGATTSRPSSIPYFVLNPLGCSCIAVAVLAGHEPQD